MVDWLVFLIGLALGAAIAWVVAQSRLGEAHKRLAVAESTVAEREKETASVRAQLAQAATAADERDTELATVRDRLARIEPILTERTAERDALKIDLDRAAADFRTLESQLQTLLQLQTRLEVEKANLIEQKQQIEQFLAQAQTQLKDTFSALATTALDESTKRFLQQAEERMKAQADLAASDLTARQTQISDVLEPVKKTLEKLELQTNERGREFVSVKSELDRIALAHSSLSSETRRLTDALKSSRVRGRWGEVALKRLLELAGLNNYFDFQEQPSHEVEGSRLRPDYIVRLPGSRCVVIDVKTPGENYINALEAATEDERTLLLKRHADNLHDHIKKLAAKDYSAGILEAGDYVIMFVPSESILDAALAQRPELLELAISQRVMPASPSTMMALLRTIELMWQQQQGFENAEEIRLLGQELYKRLKPFVGHLQALGATLDKSQDLYRKTVGSLESRVLKQAQKLGDFGVKIDPDHPLTLAIEGEYLLTDTDLDSERPVLAN